MRLDALANATGLVSDDVLAVAAEHPRARGVVQLRKAVRLMDGGAESPQETRTRLLLMTAGFPRPQTQIIVVDQRGRFVARIDLGWRECKVGVEYDGPQHWTDSAQHARDIDRLAELQACGWRIVRASRDLLRYRPQVFLDRVHEARRDAARSMGT
jgi:very-short-patch-repair endonuclease